MAVIVQYTTPSATRMNVNSAGTTTWMDVLDHIFDATSFQVTAKVFPITPATKVNSATLTVNLQSVNLNMSGQNPTTITFNLGNSTSGENTGAMNSAVLTITDDDNNTQSRAQFSYFRKQ
jgi:hypothetical protein